jgi:pimeloyl-ACP methyl ester carboxylesterase
VHVYVHGIPRHVQVEKEIGPESGSDRRPIGVVHEAAQAYAQWLSESDVPKLLLRATPGAIMREPLVQWCRDHMPPLKVVDIGPGVHFVQEDQPHAIGRAIADWYTGH